jgi:sphingomyelin synthase-related protein 1
MSDCNVENWTTNDVRLWLESLGFNDYIHIFKEHCINGKALLLINEDDIKDLVVNNIGDRKNLYFSIKKLQKSFEQIKNDSYLAENDSIHKISGHICENCLKQTNESSLNFKIQDLEKLKNEKLKTFLSIIYCFCTCLWTSFVLTIVHNRVPDMNKYPPLPDIILDNVPLINWAFYATEIIAIFLGILMITILIFHKYRFIILRRIFSLGGTIFILRSITMIITSLSVPGIHIKCSSQRYNSLTNQIIGAWDILSGAGLAIKGVRTCGDYMFSGHTVVLTLLTHFICECKTPSSYISYLFLYSILNYHFRYSLYFQLVTYICMGKQSFWYIFYTSCS